MNTQVNTIPQGFHKLFAYGCICPDRGREFEKKRRDKERLKRLYNIYN